MAEDTHPPTPEIAHVLFIDIVGYSRETITSQSRLIGELTDTVNGAPAFAEARSQNRVLSLPTGDGMALLFFDDVFAPARCAQQIAHRAGSLPIRMGIHSGLVQRQTDIAGSENVVGEGINTAARVMDFGDAGHILLSGQYASYLRQFDEWAPHVFELGSAVAKHGQELTIFNFVGDGFGRPERPAKLGAAETPEPRSGSLRIVLVYRRKTEPDDQVLAMLEAALTSQGHDVFIDTHLKIGVEWAAEVESKIRAADVVIPIVSDAAVGSEMLEYEVETALDEHRKRDKPYVLPVRVGSDRPIEGTIGGYLNGLNFTVWKSHEDDRRLVDDLTRAMAEPPKQAEIRQLEPVGGAVAPDSPFYVERPADAEFAAALRANESILLVKGPRQVGKTSLIGRGAKLVGELGWRSAITDFQKLSSSQFASEDGFYRLLAALLSRNLKFVYDFESEWLDVFGANMNMDNFVRALLDASATPTVWFMDEADKLFGAPFASDFFGLVRSWHNSRATEPGGPWSRLTVVIGYATEAHLFIQDLNQSPFNVGRQLPLTNFTVAQTADLNSRYGAPLTSAEVPRLWELVGGQPFLTRRALDVVSRGAMDFPTLIETAARDDGPFGDHLRRILISVTQMPQVVDALRASITNPELKDSEGLHRLVSAGIVRQEGNRIVLMCELYATYLGSHFAA